MNARLVAVLFLCALHPVFADAGQVPARPGGAGALQPTRRVVGTELTSRANPPIRIRVAAGFRYVGGQRFILREMADVEQHLFVETDSGNAITRVYWTQFERFLPGRPGTYAYATDQPLDLSGFAMRVHVRRFTDPPASDSDRRRAYDLLSAAGLVMPPLATRVRLVYVPEGDRRQELMIVYMEPAATAADVTPEDATAIVERATTGLSLGR